MAQFKTGRMLEVPGIKIVTACSYLTVEKTLFMGRGMARLLKLKVPGIDGIFGKMLLDNGGHLGRYGLLTYERWGVLQVRHHYDERADLDLITFGLEILKSFAKDTSYIISLEYAGLEKGELSKEEVGPILKGLPDNVYIWEGTEGQYGIHSRTQF